MADGHLGPRLGVVAVDVVLDLLLEDGELDLRLRLHGLGAGAGVGPPVLRAPRL